MDLITDVLILMNVKYWVIRVVDVNIFIYSVGVLMARWKTCGAAGAGGAAAGAGSANARAEVTGAAAAAHVSRLTAAALVRAGAPRHCYNVLAALLPYWKEKTTSMYLLILVIKFL